MTHAIQLPQWISQSWVAYKMYPGLRPVSARAKLSRKLAGDVAWKEAELDRLAQIFLDIDGAEFSDHVDWISDELFGKIEDE